MSETKTAPMGIAPAHPACDVFHKDVGDWEATVETKLPNGTVSTSRGISRSRLISGGKWLVTDFENETGFDGHGVVGYDPVRARYVATWVDPLRTFLSVMEGTWDEPTKTMTMLGETQRRDGGAFRWRETTTLVDPDTQVFRSFVRGTDGRETETMVVTYRRKNG